jgi:hypothetical protein
VCDDTNYNGPRYLQKWDIELRLKNRKIALTLDNFSGHEINYEPKNITLIYFEPNMTSHIQPLDAGIIRCFKAIYRREHCLRAIEKDEADDRDIYKMNILESMLMVKRAWSQVSQKTIKNCWDHTKIQRPAIPPIVIQRSAPTWNPAYADGWDVLMEWVSESWTLPEVEARLKNRLGDRYRNADWNKAFDAVLSAENDVFQATENLRALRQSFQAIAEPNPPKTSLSAMPIDVTVPPNEQQIKAVEDLARIIADLKDRRQIRGEPRDVDELIDPVQEREIGGLHDDFTGTDVEIVEKIQREHIEVIDEEDDEVEAVEDALPTTSKQEMIELCRTLEKASIFHDVQGGLEVSEVLRRYRGWKQAASDT